MDIEIFKRTIFEDRTNGLTPFCVVGNAGTVNTGAIDPLNKMQAICETENLWFHIDGTFGTFALQPN